MTSSLSLKHYIAEDLHLHFLMWRLRSDSGAAKMAEAVQALQVHHSCSNDKIQTSIMSFFHCSCQVLSSLASWSISSMLSVFSPAYIKHPLTNRATLQIKVFQVVSLFRCFFPFHQLSPFISNSNLPQVFFSVFQHDRWLL